MTSWSEKLWSEQNRHPGDRSGLFAAVAGFVEPSTVLYPGSFIDLAASFVFPSVTYVDIDRRAARFFADTDAVEAIVTANAVDDRARSFDFVPADYQGELDLEERSFDLLVSLYAGFVSGHCTEPLRIGGTLLVNPSHGDAAMASLDPRYRLAAVVKRRDGRYRVDTAELDRYLEPKRPEPITVEGLHRSGRGVAYTRSPFAYLFERIG